MADLVFPGQATGTALNNDAMPLNKDLVIYKGDYVELFVTVKDSNNVVLDLTGYTASAVLKTDYTITNPSASFTCSIPNPTSGTVRIYMPTSVSTNLIATSYIWDFQIVNQNNDARTYLTGDVTVYPQVTS